MRTVEVTELHPSCVFGVEPVFDISEYLILLLCNLIHFDDLHTSLLLLIPKHADLYH